MLGLLWQGLQGLPRTEVISVVADFSSYKLLKTSVDSTPTHTRLQRTYNACSLSPPRSKHCSQEGAQLHSPEKIFIPNMNFPRSPAVPCSVTYTAKPSALAPVWAERVHEDSSCISGDWGNVMSTSLTYSYF